MTGAGRTNETLNTATDTKTNTNGRDMLKPEFNRINSELSLSEIKASGTFDQSQKIRFGGGSLLEIRPYKFTIILGCL